MYVCMYEMYEVGSHQMCYCVIVIVNGGLGSLSTPRPFRSSLCQKYLIMDVYNYIPLGLRDPS